MKRRNPTNFLFASLCQVSTNHLHHMRNIVNSISPQVGVISYVSFHCSSARDSFPNIISQVNRNYLRLLYSRRYLHRKTTFNRRRRLLTAPPRRHIEFTGRLNGTTYRLYRSYITSRITASIVSNLRIVSISRRREY